MLTPQTPFPRGTWFDPSGHGEPWNKTDRRRHTLSKLTTTAWIAHNLGLAASFGGLLFGKTALNAKLDVLDS